MHQPRTWNAIRIGVWALAGLTLAVALAFGGTVVALPGCTSCHREPGFTSATMVKGHAGISCVRCHVSAGVPHRIAYAYNLIFAQTLALQPTGGGPVTTVSDTTCLSCHADVLTRKVTKGPSILHSQCAKGRMCVECHSGAAHGTGVKWLRSADMNLCLGCHNTDRVRSNCDTCHANRAPRDRIRTGEWQVTHGPKWRQTHGMGDLKTCAACHPKGFCARCHGIDMPHGGDFIRTHPAEATTNRKDCAVCHQVTFCDACHGLRMPHPSSFTPQHSKLVQREGDEKCLRCHVQDDCTLCHTKHIHPGGAKRAPGATS